MEPPLDALSARLAERSRAWALAHWYWGDAILVDGLLELGDGGLEAAREQALELLRRWLETVPPGPGDALAPGAALARMEAEGELPREALDRFLDALERLPLLFRDVPSLEPHLPRFRFGVCIDALYHLPPALAAAARRRGRPELAERALRICIQLLHVLRCEGGWAQWYDAALGRNNGVPWSRGAGWALLGLLDTARQLPDRSAPLEEPTLELLRRLVATQGAGGHWGPVLGRRDLPEESSVAALFVAAAGHPAAPTVDAAAVARARAAVLGSLDPGGVYLGVSADVLPDWDPRSYESFRVEASPWGQGAALRALAAMARGGASADPT